MEEKALVISVDWFNLEKRPKELRMNPMKIEFNLDDVLDEVEVIALYEANQWSSAQEPKRLMNALRGSHSVVTARLGTKLVGLGNAISDGFLVVYYPHLLVDSSYWDRGIGKGMMALMQTRYEGFHQQMLTADSQTIGFYEKLGFTRAGKTEPMWIYQGDEH